MSLTEKERVILKFMNEYGVGGTKDIADDMHWSPRSTTGVMTSLRKKGLVEERRMKFFPADKWNLTEEGKKVFNKPSGDNLYNAFKVGLIDELRDTGVSNPERYLERHRTGSVSLIFFFRAIKKQFPYYTVKQFHSLLALQRYASWIIGKYKFYLSTGLPISNVVGYPSVTLGQFKKVCDGVRWRFITVTKLEG